MVPPTPEGIQVVCTRHARRPQELEARRRYGFPRVKVAAAAGSDARMQRSAKDQRSWVSSVMFLPGAWCHQPVSS